MEEIATAHLSLIEDRGTRKIRVNVLRNGRLIGYLRPINPFKERRQPPGGFQKF